MTAIDHEHMVSIAQDGYDNGLMAKCSCGESWPLLVDGSRIYEITSHAVAKEQLDHSTSKAHAPTMKCWPCQRDGKECHEMRCGWDGDEWPCKYTQRRERRLAREAQR